MGPDQHDLERALYWFARLVDLAPDALPDRLRGYLADRVGYSAGALVGLVHGGLKCYREYEHGDRAEALDGAIALFAEALAALPDDHVDRAATLSDLGLALRARFERTLVAGDLDAAVRAGRSSVESTSPDDPDRALHLSTLANSLHTRFEHSGDLDDLNEAVDMAWAAVRATPADGPDRAMYLSNVGNALRARFERTGASEDLEAAVRAGWAAVRASAAAADVNRPMYLSNLGLALRVRFEATGAEEDVDEAVRVGRMSVETAAADDPDPDPDPGLEPEPERANGDRSRAVMIDILGWLWAGVAEPVLNALGYTRAPQRPAEWPRVWWCPIGPIAFLPLHAAGMHAGDAREARTVSQRVVSSYTPTLAALIRARASAPPEQVRQLVVALPQTPGRDSLPAVDREVAAIAERLPPPWRARHLSGADATFEAIRAELPRYPWVHFAGHASHDPRHPAGSAFLLWDWQQRPLTVGELAGLRLAHADLAFLSACQTSTGSARLHDESIHLAAAMQVIGYRHVIATLWPVGDTVGPRLAAAVYAGLAQDAPPDSTNAALALHHAVEKIRARFPGNPGRWAPYIHLGP